MKILDINHPTYYKHDNNPKYYRPHSSPPFSSLFNFRLNFKEEGEAEVLRGLHPFNLPCLLLSPRPGQHYPDRIQLPAREQLPAEAAESLPRLIHH